MKTLLLFLIFLVILAFACSIVGTGITLSIVGMFWFTISGVGLSFLGVAGKKLIVTCFGIIGISLGVGCYFLLQYFTQLKGAL